MSQADLDAIAKALYAGIQAVNAMRATERTAMAGDVSKARLIALYEGAEALKRLGVTVKGYKPPPAGWNPRPGEIPLERQFAAPPPAPAAAPAPQPVLPAAPITTPKKPAPDLPAGGW